jgi:PAS domain S-box-containing protein
MNIKKILIADDDIDFLNLYKLRFKPEYGYSICSFEDGKSLLKYFRDEYEKGKRIPLCIIDLNMPVMNGLETSIELRKIDPYVIIIIVTGYSDISSGEIRENVKHDIYYVRKPFNNDEFQCLVDSLLKNWNNTFQLKESQITLKESLDNLENLFNTIEDYVFILDLKGNILHFNYTVEKKLSYSSEELLHMRIVDLHPQKLRKKGEKILDYMIKGERYICNLPIMTKDGRIIPVETKITRGSWKHRDVFFGISRDMTDHETMEKELRKYQFNLQKLVEERIEELKHADMDIHKEIKERLNIEEYLNSSLDEYRKLSNQFQSLLDAISEPILLLGRDLMVIWANKSAVNMFKEEYCYKLPFDLLYPSGDFPAVKTFKTGREEMSQITGEDEKTYEIKSFPVKEGEIVSNVIVIIMDITEKISFQTEAIRVSHMAALGELAAGVAHEVNNPIGGIINCAEILMDNYDDIMIKDISERIINAGERVAYIVKSLLSFSRKGDDERSIVNISLLLSDVISFIYTSIKKEGIALTVNMPENLPDLYVQPREIQQVFLNIVNNARYALNEKYHGYDKNKKLEITGDTLSISGKTFVRIIFFDCGTGISSDIINKIKSPFFTTKPGGKGTGLGLSISNNIINVHNGKLEIESIKGEYTRVIIKLPVEENL